MGKNLFVEVLSIVVFHAVIAFYNIGATMWLGVSGVSGFGRTGLGGMGLAHLKAAHELGQHNGQKAF